MTVEEAIRILDPETRREEMKKIPVFERIDADQEACTIAIAALRAQAAIVHCRDCNAPVFQGF